MSPRSCASLARCPIRISSLAVDIDESADDCHACAGTTNETARTNKVTLKDRINHPGPFFPIHHQQRAPIRVVHLGHFRTCHTMPSYTSHITAQIGLNQHLPTPHTANMRIRKVLPTAAFSLFACTLLAQQQAAITTDPAPDPSAPTQNLETV